MNDYTPTTDEVREDFAYPWDGFKQDREGRLAAFDRWIAAHDREVAAQALREVADYQGPADEAAHFTPEARNLLRSLADRISVLATEDDRCNIPGGCCTHENTHNGLGIAGVGECTDCMNTGHMHPTEETT